MIQVDNADVTKALEQMQERAMHLQPLMRGIGMVMIKSVHENFDREGRPSRWKQLSLKTLLSRDASAAASARKTSKWKAAKGRSTKAKIEAERVQRMRGNKILQNSGSLRQSIVLGAVTDSSVEIGSSLPYARIHQLGGSVPATTVRARRAKALLIPTAGGVIFRKEAHIPERTIPARPYLVLQPHDLEVIAKMADDYLERGVIG